MKNIIVNGKQYCEVSESAAVDVTIPALKAELEALKDAIRWLLNWQRVIQPGWFLEIITTICHGVLDTKRSEDWVGEFSEQDKDRARLIMSVLEGK